MDHDDPFIFPMAAHLQEAMILTRRLPMRPLRVMMLSEYEKDLSKLNHTIRYLMPFFIHLCRLWTHQLHWILLPA
jgi:hypothetical protein